MDVDWCFCGRRTEGKSPYCSDECLQQDVHFPSLDTEFSSLSDLDDDFDHRRLSTRRVLTSRWPGTDSAGILAWASQIPQSCKPESFHDSTPKLRQPVFPVTRQRPVPPALSMSTTHPARTKSSPIATPQMSSAHAQSRSSDLEGSYTSLMSALTDSVATPASAAKSSVLARLRCWGNTTTATTASQKQPPPAHRSKSERAGFAVLSTAHPLHSDILYPTATGAKWDDKERWDGGNLHSGAAVWISKAKGGTDAFARERAPVALRVENGADHPAYLTRGRKPSRAVHRS
ncbi:hypothetical protein BD410DRAFT_802453 [Rickenella mellea]|uniref:Uncharacterized protein n=1 Tax=Rickenella mellea TaxID=50990 RepID=A0A4Y7Q7U4_9AGAM|nr:hypothetical protein BD410DRAFT_802453 [Rickenella mellea]